MKRLALGACALVLVWCVPASEARPPAGAGGFRTNPSAAARGEPFAADDGWTLTVEKLIARGYVSVRGTGGGTGNADEYDFRYGGSENYVFNAGAVLELFAPGVRPGSAEVTFNLQARSVYSDGRHYDDDSAILGVSPEDLRRMEQRADDSVGGGSVGGPGYNYTYEYAPSVLVRIRGRRGDRSVVLDLALYTQSGYIGGVGAGVYSGGVLVEIRANALATGILDVRPEVLFDDAFPFAPFAAADADEDGIVSAAELKAATMDPLPVGDAGYYPSGARLSLLSAISGRIGSSLFRQRAP